jgi:hypothetical protein
VIELSKVIHAGFIRKTLTRATESVAAHPQRQILG